MQEQEGVIERWDDQKGFGFIRSKNTKPLYFHISAMRGEQRPQQGDKVMFVPGKDMQGRDAASHVRHQGLAVDSPRIRIKPSTYTTAPKQQKPSQTVKKSPATTAKKFRLAEHRVPWIALLLLLILPVTGVVSVAVKYGVLWLLVVYVVASMIAYYCYWADKRRAKLNEWRIPEANLHFWSLIGGWPGAFVAQQQFRHKTKKISFLAVYWLTVLAHQVFWFDWLFMDARWVGQLVRLPF